MTVLKRDLLKAVPFSFVFVNIRSISYLWGLTKARVCRIKSIIFYLKKSTLAKVRKKINEGFRIKSSRKFALLLISLMISLIFYILCPYTFVCFVIFYFYGSTSLISLFFCSYTFTWEASAPHWRFSELLKCIFFAFSQILNL